MKDASMSLGIYFEIKDAELYGGEGTTGYAATIVEISIEGLQNADFEKYANSQLEAMASMATSTYFYRVYLIKVKISCSTLNVFDGKITLIILI